MLIKTRLRWLAKVDDTHIPNCLLVCMPAGGKYSLHGEKKHCNDVMVGDLLNVTCKNTGKSKTTIAAHDIGGSMLQL